MNPFAAPTIAAIATPPGRGGIGIVRVSGANLDGLLELSTELKRSKAVGYVDVNERAGRAGISSLMVAASIERDCGIETIPHLTTRDWTVKGLESLLLGTQAAGVSPDPRCR